MVLTPRQKKFVSEYLVDLNGTRAAIRAGYSPRSASVHAARMIANANVRGEIDSALQRRAERVEVRADDVLRELLRLACVDVGQAFGSDGRMLPLARMPEDVRRAISSVEVEEDDDGAGVRKVRFCDKVRALEMLGRHLQMFVDRGHVTLVTLEQLVLASGKPE